MQVNPYPVKVYAIDSRLGTNEETAWTEAAQGRIRTIGLRGPLIVKLSGGWPRGTSWILPCIGLLYLALYHFDFILDDPFISFRYARNLLEGHGLVFNPGERVEGYSNFLWVVLLLPFMKSGLGPVAASKVLGLFFGVLTVYFTYRLPLLLIEDNPWKYRTAFYASALTGFSWYFALWSVGGLETSLFSFLVLLSPAIDIFYSLDGRDMPIIHAWPLDPGHSARLFVGSNTPKGRYLYRAIRDSRDRSPTGWIRVDVPVLVK